MINQYNGLNYLLSEKGLFFYYKNNLLFFHSTKTPFISVIDNNITVLLTECKVVKNNEEEYIVSFSRGKYIVDCSIYKKENKVYFTVFNYHNYKKIEVSLYKENKQKVLNMFSYNKKENIKFLDKVLKRVKKIPMFPRETKLSFYVENKYLFKNIDIEKYKLKIYDNIYIELMQEKNNFVMDFGYSLDETNFLEEEYPFTLVGEKKIYLSSEYKKEDYLGKVDGILVKDGNLKKSFFYKKYYEEVIYYIRPVLEKDSQFLRYFTKNEVILENGKYKINFECETAQLSFKTIIRKHFDYNEIDGVFIDFSDYSQEEVGIMKKAIMSLLDEYPKKYLFFNRISSTNDICGYYIIDDREKTIKQKEYITYYKYIGEYFLGASIENVGDIEKIAKECKVIIVG